MNEQVSGVRPVGATLRCSLDGKSDVQSAVGGDFAVVPLMARFAVLLHQFVAADRFAGCFGFLACDADTVGDSTELAQAQSTRNTCHRTLAGAATLVLMTPQSRR